MTHEILFYLQSLLGDYKLTSTFREAIFHCPFCNHRKRKLSINVQTGLWHCWVCQSYNGTKGNIFYLLKRINASAEIIDKFKNFYGNNVSLKRESAFKTTKASLPKEYQFIFDIKDLKSRLNAFYYLKKRGITDDDIVRYRIGFCDKGEYENRIILPSYDKYFNLNYFVARSIFDDVKPKYKNPPVTKNLIFFEHLVDWNYPVVLCEGFFDAIAIRRNAIPLGGKFLSDALIEEIFSNKPEVIVCLDNDALKDSLEIYRFLSQNGILVRLCLLDGKDPSEIGFFEVWKKISLSKTLSFSEFLKLKLGGRDD